MKAVGSMSRVMAGLKGQHNQARGSWFSPENAFLFVNDRKNPYTFPRGAYYLWLRGRNVGGRFLSWGRVAVRMSDYDFKAASRDGFGEDWPVSYDELVPYYDQVEEFLGIIGTSDGIPNLPDGKYVKQAGLSRLERQLKEKVESTWPERKVIPWRYAVAEATPTDESGENRTSSPLVAAQRTGRMELKPNAIAKQLDIDPNTGKATGVTYVDAVTKRSHQVSANVVVICASTIETIRLLLNSACAKHPNGVGNSSGTLGRYFIDQCPCLVFGTVPGETAGSWSTGRRPRTTTAAPTSRGFRTSTVSLTPNSSGDSTSRAWPGADGCPRGAGRCGASWAKGRCCRTTRTASPSTAGGATPGGYRFLTSPCA